MSTPQVACIREDWADPEIPLPLYETSQAAGCDLRANLAVQDRSAGIQIEPGSRVLVPTGLRVAIPEGWEMQIRPRSGLALKHGITLANAPGTVDADYRGPLGVILINLGMNAYTVAHGERIAQAVLSPVVQLPFAEVAELDATDRGEGGFGSTGRGVS